MLAPHHGGTNEKSRFTLLRSMTIDQTFNIDGHDTWTIDWAQTPDGHFYSNKPPGSAFLAMPFYAPLDLVRYSATPQSDRKYYLSHPLGLGSRRLVSILTQVGLFVLVWLLLTYRKRLHPMLAGGPTQIIILTAALLGSLPAAHMNNLCGHGLSAVIMVLLANALLQSYWKSAGLLFGLPVESEKAWA